MSVLRRLGPNFYYPSNIFSILPSLSNSSRFKWRIFLEGGGWCTGDEDCLLRSKVCAVPRVLSGSSISSESAIISSSTPRSHHLQGSLGSTSGLPDDTFYPSNSGLCPTWLYCLPFFALVVAPNCFPAFFAMDVCLFVESHHATGSFFMASDALISPGFSDWNSVFVKYCDGSSFTGDNSTASIVNGTRIHYRGAAMYTPLHFVSSSLHTIFHSVLRHSRPLSFRDQRCQ